MRRTTISLPDDLGSALEREARRQHTSVSAIARTAISHHLGMDREGPRELPFAAVGHSGHRSTAKDMEQLLEREWDELPRDR